MRCATPRRLLPPLAALLLVIAVSVQARAHCFDGKRDDTETDVDCGGACSPCAYGDSCVTWRDCITGRCGAGTCEERVYEGGPAPPGYRVELSTHDAAATARKTGFGFFAVGYAAAYVGALTVPTDNAVLFLPVYGPWSMSARKGQDNPGLLIVDAVLQTVGAVLIIGGAASAGKQLIREEEKPVRVAPRRVGRDGCGLGLALSF